MNYNLEIIKLLFYLILIIASIYLISVFVKKGLGQRRGCYLSIIEQIYLNPKKSLALVMVKDKIFLISIGEKEVSVLERWTKEEFGSVEKVKPQSFKGLFQQIMKDNKRDPYA